MSSVSTTWVATARRSPVRHAPTLQVRPRDVRDTELMRELAWSPTRSWRRPAWCPVGLVHQLAYDLLAENERSRLDFDAAIDLSRRTPRADRRAEQHDGPTSRPPCSPRRRAPSGTVAPAGLDLRVPEACLGVLRARRLGAVQAAVHDPAAGRRRSGSASGASCACPARSRRGAGHQPRIPDLAIKISRPGPRPHRRRGNQIRNFIAVRDWPWHPPGHQSPDAVNNDFNLCRGKGNHDLALGGEDLAEAAAPGRVSLRVGHPVPSTSEPRPPRAQAKAILDFEATRPPTRCRRGDCLGPDEMDAGRLTPKTRA